MDTSRQITLAVTDEQLHDALAALDFAVQIAHAVIRTGTEDATSAFVFTGPAVEETRSLLADAWNRADRAECRCDDPRPWIDCQQHN